MKEEEMKEFDEKFGVDILGGKVNQDDIKSWIASKKQEWVEAGKEEGSQEKFRVGIARLEGEYEQSIRTATLKECIEIGEKMPPPHGLIPPSPTESVSGTDKWQEFWKGYRACKSDYQEQLKKLL